MVASKITTELAVDDPLVQNAAYRFSPADRAYLDAQIRGVQQHLVDSLIRGSLGSWFEVSSASPTLTPGDVVCLAGTSSAGQLTIRLATTAALLVAGAPMGIVVVGAVPGALAKCVLAGTVPAAITGLSSAGLVQVTSVGRATVVAAYEQTSYPLGTSDASGNLALTPRPEHRFWNDELTGSSGSMASLHIEYTVNQSGTAQAVGLRLLGTETALGSAGHFPIEVYAAGGELVFQVRNDGAILFPFNSTIILPAEAGSRLTTPLHTDNSAGTVALFSANEYDTAGGGFTLAMPDVGASDGAGASFLHTGASANGFTLNGSAGGGTIEGAATKTWTTVGARFSLLAVNGIWRVFGTQPTS